jgi:ubiquitin-like-conjugating enzyme ATG3
MSVQQSFTDLKNVLHSTVVSVSDSLGLVSLQTESEFHQKGVLTPQEFVSAGDLLVLKCTSWTWSPGQGNIDYLPKDKQCLITRKVACRQAYKASDGNQKDKTQSIQSDIGDWELTAEEQQEKDSKEVALGVVETSGTQPVGDEDSDSEPVGDMEDFVDEEIDLIEDSAAAKQSDFEKLRSYDISITYDKLYATPRVWLFGYSENLQPLSSKQIFMDISDDHAQKTVTMETHPCFGNSWATIHPCKHSHVMQKFVARSADSGHILRVDQYLLLFLKVLGAVLPTINYDNTHEIEL